MSKEECLLTVGSLSPKFYDQRGAQNVEGWGWPGHLRVRRDAGSNLASGDGNDQAGRFERQQRFLFCRQLASVVWPKLLLGISGLERCGPPHYLPVFSGEPWARDRPSPRVTAVRTKKVYDRAATPLMMLALKRFLCPLRGWILMPFWLPLLLRAPRWIRRDPKLLIPLFVTARITSKRNARKAFDEGKLTRHWSDAREVSKLRWLATRKHQNHARRAVHVVASWLSSWILLRSAWTLSYRLAPCSTGP